MKYSLAIDIGASGGKALVGYIEEGMIKTDEIYRFPNGMDSFNGSLVWDTERLFSEIKAAIKAALKKYPELSSVSVDTWGVDYVLLRGDEEVMPVYAYRDSRNLLIKDKVHEIIPFDELYRITGIQYNSFNSIYSLFADKISGRLDGVTDFLMLPEYLMYKLTGVKKKEYTEATTTALVDYKTGKFSKEIFERLGLPTCLIRELSMPGESVGFLKPDIVGEVGGNLEVVLCPTHDTASAVEAIEMEENSPYISSGTWSLLGIKTDAPLTDEKSRNSGYSNEGGVGYNRYQKNIIGMWFIQCLRKEFSPEEDYGNIVKLAEESSYKEIFDVTDERFLAPASMSAEITDYFKERGIAPPKTHGDFYSAAYRSIARGYKDAIDDLELNTGKKYEKIYIAGGGAKNAFLNGIVEAESGKTVVALPKEASIAGNLKSQLYRY